MLYIAALMQQSVDSDTFILARQMRLLLELQTSDAKHLVFVGSEVITSNRLSCVYQPDSSPRLFPFKRSLRLPVNPSPGMRSQSVGLP